MTDQSKSKPVQPFAGPRPVDLVARIVTSDSSREGSFRSAAGASLPEPDKHLPDPPGLSPREILRWRIERLVERGPRP